MRILIKYLGGVNLANMSSTITSQVKCFLQNYMCELLKAMKDDGCNVIGYSVWSLMDNFEWTNGYT
jgi:beta-glucosidase/6-phospho-beta-glucosidase/beta-galactosidase